MAGSASNPLPLREVLADLAQFERGLVLVRGNAYGAIERLYRQALDFAKSPDHPLRRFVTEREFWSEKDRDGKIVVMRRTPRGPEPYFVELWSQTHVPLEDDDWSGNSGLHGPDIGRAKCPGHVFAQSCYVFGNRYTWEQLPPGARKDALKQRDDFEWAYGRGPEGLLYSFALMPHAELVRVLQQEYGAAFAERLASPEVRRMARSIAKEGLKSPPVGQEGWRRALALASLGLDMPFFAEIPPFAVGEPTFIPTLEGARTELC